MRGCSPRAVLAALLLVAALIGPARPAQGAASSAPTAQAGTATLTIVAGQAQVQPPGGSFAAASNNCSKAAIMICGDEKWLAALPTPPR